MAGAITLVVYAFATHPDIQDINRGNGNAHRNQGRRRNERRPVPQEFSRKEKVLIDDRYEAIVIAQFYDPDRVKVRYTNGRPKWFFNKYIFYCDDYSIKPLDNINGLEDERMARNERANSDLLDFRRSTMMAGYRFQTHICKHGAWIAGSPSLAHMEQMMGK